MKSGTRPRRCSISSIRCARCCKACSAAPAEPAIAWQLWERWISEIVADFWSVARVGIASTIGLIGVVSLPRPSCSVSTPMIRIRCPGSA